MPRADYEQTLSAIYAAALDPDGWPQALELVADFVGGNGAMIVRNDLRGKGSEIRIARLRDDLSILYIDRHSANALVQAVAAQGRLGEAMVASHLVDHDVVRKTEWYADILAPQQIRDQVVLPYKTLSPEGSTGGFGVTLNDRQAEDGGAAAERLIMLGPHLSRALDMSLEVARHRDEAVRMGALIDVLPTAAVLLNGLGRIARANTAAETLLQRGDGLSVGPGYVLRATLEEEDRIFAKAIAAAMAFASGAIETSFEQAVTVRRPSGQPALLAILMPLPPASFHFLDALETRAALLIRILDPMHEPQARNDLLRSIYGLTGAETRVAALVAQGLTAPEVAARLGISVNTVRTHLARTFDKTGTHSQVALARLLGHIGPQPGPPHA